MIPRAFLSEPVHVGDIHQVTGEQGHHFARVLRVRVGEPIAVAFQGSAFLGTIDGVDGKSGHVSVKITDVLPCHEPAVNVYLVQGLAKGDKIDTIIQKSVEVGVSEIALVGTQRSVVRLHGDKVANKVDRWQKIAWEAASQSQRDKVPNVVFAEHANHLKTWLDTVHPDGIFLLDEDETSLGIQTALRKYPSVDPDHGRSFVIVVGPEGGWDDAERAFWVETYGAQLVSMGPRIMRTETAGVVGITAVLYEYGELGG